MSGDEPLLPGPIDELRKAVRLPADARANGIERDAAAAAYAAEQARAAGVPSELVTRYAADAFERIFQQVAPVKARRRFFRREPVAAPNRQLPMAPEPPQLPRGD